jgi:hypothetical protein
MRFRAAATWAAAAGLAATASAAFGLAPDAPQPPKWYETVTVSGWVQLDAIFPEGGATIDKQANFRIRRARPTISAQIDPATRVQIQLDASTGKSGSGNATATVCDTFAERKVADAGYVLFGQYVLPYGAEIWEDNASVRSPMEMSFIADRLALGERDLGLQFRSSPKPSDPIWWGIALVNGQGFRSADGNTNKTVAGRYAYTVRPGFRVGASALVGKWRSATAGKDFDRHVLGCEAHVTLTENLELTGEFYNARFVDDTAAAAPNAARVNGGYLMIEKKIKSINSIPFIRYQRTYGDLDYRSFDLGWRYQYAKTQRVTVEYDIARKAKMSAFGARWQLGF